MRLRTTKTGNNTMTTFGWVKANQPHHIIMTYRPGHLQAWVNGKRCKSTRRVGGDFSNWASMQLLFGDEFKATRDWDGRIQHIAIYAKAFNADQAAAHYKAVEPLIKKLTPHED